MFDFMFRELLNDYQIKSAMKNDIMTGTSELKSTPLYALPFY